MLLTRSLYMKGQQCPRLLWLASRKLLLELSFADSLKMKNGEDASAKYFLSHIKKRLMIKKK